MFRILSALKRLPPPLVPLVPMSITWLGPGFLLWLLAFHVIDVPFPQETIAPYSHTPLPAPQVARGQPPAAASAVTEDSLARTVAQRIASTDDGRSRRNPTK